MDNLELNYNISVNYDNNRKLKDIIEEQFLLFLKDKYLKKKNNVNDFDKDKKSDIMQVSSNLAHINRMGGINESI